MGSSYYGEPNMGNERGGGSSRKGKKSNSEKPKQPQRGLGVAQLEKIRLQGQLGTCATTTQATYHQYPSLHTTTTHYPYHSNFIQEDMRVQQAAAAGFSSIPASDCFSYSSTTSAPSASYAYYPNVTMGHEDYERSNMIYRDSHSPTSIRGIQANHILDSQHFAQPSSSTKGTLFNLQLDQGGVAHPKKNKKHRSQSMESNSPTSESSDTQELDLELRLSL